MTDDANDILSVNGELYFTDETDGVGQIGAFNPLNQDYAVFVVPELPPPPPPHAPPRNQYPNMMTLDSNGNIWFTESNATNTVAETGAIGEFNPTTGAFAQSYLTTGSSDPVGIVWDPVETQFWMTEPSSNQLVSYNPSTSGSGIAPTTFSDPQGLLVDPTTGYVWIAEGGADKIVEYDPNSSLNGGILFSFSTSGSPSQLAWGPDGNIWFTESGAVGVLVPPTGPGTGSIKVQIPVSGTAYGIAVGPSSGTYGDTMWFTMSGSNQIGEISVNNDSLVGYATAPDTNANLITFGSDGNMWFTSGSGTPSWIGAVVLNPADLGAQVVVTTQPPNTEATSFGGFTYGFGMVVAVENGAGQLDPFVQQGTLTIAIANNPSGGQLAGTLTLPVSDGVAIFDGLTINQPGKNYAISAAYSLGLNTPVTNGFNVTGPAAKLVVTAEPPSSVQAGTSFGLTVQAEDANGLVVPTFDDAVSLSILTDPPGDGVLNGPSISGALYGIAVFGGVSIDQEGVGYTLQAKDIATLPPTDPNPLPNSTSTSAFTITAGPAVQLAFSASGEPPATAAAGQNLATPTPIVVDAEDQFGSIDLTYSGAVTIALANNATGKLVGTLTVNAVKGVATFTNLAIDTVGKYNLGATSGKLTAGTSSSVTISAATASQLVWTTQPPGTATEGIPLGTVTLQVEDKYGNLEPNYSQGVAISLDLNGQPDASDLGGTATATASGGVVTFPGLLINNLGDPFTLVANSVDGLTSHPSNPIDVVAPSLVVTTSPVTAVTAGSGFTIAVTVETNTGATDTSYSGSVALAIGNGPTGSTIGGKTFAAVTNGVATISGVVLDIAGTYLLQASSGTLASVDSPQISVAADSADQTLYFVQQPQASVQAGAGISLEVGAEDQFGNVSPLSGQVAIAIANNPGDTTLGGTLSATASKGVAKFSGLTLDIAANDYTLTVTSSSAASATSNGIDVTPSAATKLAIPANGEPPSKVAAGQQFPLTVDAEDPYGNLDPTFDGTVVITLPNNVTGTTSVSAVNGVASFTQLVIENAGTYTLQASSSPLTAATSSSITVGVNSSTPSQLGWAQQPPTQVGDNVGFGAVVDVEDKYGNVETTYNGNVTVALDANPGGATLAGTFTVAAQDGVATFSGLSIGVIDSGYTLQATGDGLTSPASNPIDVVANQAVAFELTLQPPGSVEDTQSFGLTVTALTQTTPVPVVDPDFGGQVTVSIATPAGSTDLSGKTTINAINGVAAFTGLTLSQIGTYTLDVSSSGIPTITTGTINVTAGHATQLVVVTEPPSSTTAGSTFGFEVEAEDPLGDPR